MVSGYWIERGLQGQWVLDREGPSRSVGTG